MGYLTGLNREANICGGRLASIPLCLECRNSLVRKTLEYLGWNQRVLCVRFASQRHRLISVFWDRNRTNSFYLSFAC